jgi:hypothetical protein
MNIRTPLLALLLLALSPPLLAANPCQGGGAFSPQDGSGSGGTGLSAMSGSGSGGTGQVARREDGSGVGGTGETVEVEGVVTGFASICVNGLELHYAANTPISIDGRNASSRELAVGQVVRAQAFGRGNQLQAQRVQIRHLLVAPLQSRAPDQLQAMGQRIVLSPGTQLAPTLQPGTQVAVSGFVAGNGQIVATRIDTSAPGSDSLSGEITRNARGQLTLNGVLLHGRGVGLKPGERARVEGRFEHGGLQVERVERDSAGWRAERVVIQGIARGVGKAALNVGNQHIRLDRQTRQTAPVQPGQWVRIDAQRDGKILHAREVEIQENPLPDRHASGYTKGDKAQQPTRPGKHDDPDAHRQSDAEPRSESDHSGALQHGEKIDKPDKIEKPEKIERPEKVEKIERPEKVEKIERPEKVEKMEKIERPERRELDSHK